MPIRIEGEIPAEKIGLVVLHQLDEVEIEALPKDLPNEFVIDGSKLAELHDKIIVADLSVPSGVTILTAQEQPIATVTETKAQMSEDTAEEAAEVQLDAEGNPIEPESAEGGETPAAENAADQKTEE